MGQWENKKELEHGDVTYSLKVGDGGVCETEDAIKGVVREGARESRDGREGLAGDGDTSDFDVLGKDGARHGGAIAVLDGEVPGHVVVRPRLAGVVPVLGLADGARALDAGDPEVGGAGVEVDGERLGGGADGDRAGPLGIVRLVGQRLSLTLCEVLGELRERLDDGTLLEDVRADVLLKVDQVRAVLAGRRGMRGASALLV